MNPIGLKINNLSLSGRIKIPHELKKMNVFFKEAGFEAYLVGGAVRDMLLGKTETDWDLTTNATPEQVMKIFKKVIPTGITHGTVTVLFMGKQIEVTTYRTDSDYSDGRHPDKVIFTSSLEDDLSRRDFTMNAIAASLETGEIKDPFNGISDIKNKIIRTVGNPFDRFTEDGLRPIRAIRFSSQLDFEIEKKTFEAITTPEVRKKTLGISIERFRDEFVKTLKSNAPSKGFHLMDQTGILEYFIPELSSCRGVIQGDGRGFHEFDVLDHLLYACDGACKDNLIVRLAALFHDIGKPETKRTEQLSDGSGEKITFYNHESVSERITEKVLTRLRFPNATVNEVCHLVKNHMFYYEPTWSDAAVRRFIARVGLENIDNLFELRLADVYGMHKIPVRLHDSEVGKNLCELKDRIEKVMQQNCALGIKDLAVNGKDLIQSGIPAGKNMGKILSFLLEAVMDDPEQNTKEKLTELALNFYNQIN